MKFALTVFLALAGCYLKSYPVTSAVVEESTYRIDGERMAGTAWVVAPGYVVTAGHVCERLAGAPATLSTTSGRKVVAHPVIWEMSDDAHADACILHADAELGRPLVLAKEPPPVGTADGYVGYPGLRYTVAFGHYMADGGSDAACAPGASGSALYTERGVYGVLVQIRTAEDGTWLDGCLATPIAEVKELLNSVGVGYTETPNALPEPETHFDL